MALHVDWSENGIQYSMGRRDRFTQAALKKDMNRDPLQNSVLLDEKNGLYISNVVESRWAVVWQLDEDGTWAVMKYAFPMQFRTHDPAKLKAMLFTIIPRDSHGLFTLESLVPGIEKIPENAVPPAPQKKQHKPFVL